MVKRERKNFGTELSSLSRPSGRQNFHILEGARCKYADNVNQGRLSIEYCPTGDMIADYFTKPLQGSPFRKMLKQILNIDDDMINSSPQECVKDNDIETNQTSQTKTGQS
ncbi:hypothetical protein IV203_032619 [Nitzschia inconspicua]|uniref:Uncharacterized protein n=1 Tax=Nitzschia inconspicua TaxID=303405 RepID=A0A9K3PF47_9STRA|nr:hypothetical protein IV203_032619 [Nitzschia inconspicua]